MVISRIKNFFTRKYFSLNFLLINYPSVIAVLTGNRWSRYAIIVKFSFNVTKLYRAFFYIVHSPRTAAFCPPFPASRVPKWENWKRKFIFSTHSRTWTRRRKIDGRSALSVKQYRKRDFHHHVHFWADFFRLKIKYVRRIEINLIVGQNE